MNEKLEAVWFVVVSFIGLLFVIVFYGASEVMAVHAATGTARIPGSFWVLVVAFSSLCALVPYLLRNSPSAAFRISAIALTGIAPVVAVAFIVANLWLLTHP